MKVENFCRFLISKLHTPAESEDDRVSLARQVDEGWLSDLVTKVTVLCPPHLFPQVCENSCYLPYTWCWRSSCTTIQTTWSEPLHTLRHCLDGLPTSPSTARSGEMSTLLEWEGGEGRSRRSGQKNVAPPGPSWLQVIFLTANADRRP